VGLRTIPVRAGRQQAGSGHTFDSPSVVLARVANVRHGERPMRLGIASVADARLRDAMEFWRTEIAGAMKVYCPWQGFSVPQQSPLLQRRLAEKGNGVSLGPVVTRMRYRHE